MTTLIKHYVRKTSKAMNKEHWNAIFEDGALKTEKQVHKIADGVESDLLWFTTADTVAGGASNYLLQLIRTFMSARVEEEDNMREMFNAHLAKQDADEDSICALYLTLMRLVLNVGTHTNRNGVEQVLYVDIT